MFYQLLEITNFIINAFLHIWPYLLITIPLAVAVEMSGASKYITRAFQASPLLAILLATLVGAFSPFCSCSVIPLVASMLIGGVPLAPVMAFWVASPSMDPEIFFLSLPFLGWQLAVSRLIATFALSLSAGLITHWVGSRGWLGDSILRSQQPTSTQSSWTLIRQGWQRLNQGFRVAASLNVLTRNVQPVSEAACGAPSPLTIVEHRPSVVSIGSMGSVSPTGPGEMPAGATSPGLNPPAAGCGPSCASAPAETEAPSCGLKPASFRQRLWAGTWAATLMMVKFMALAFLLEALIVLYVPSVWIVTWLGGQNSWAIISAVLIGVPIYTTELAALPLIGGLLTQGMDPGAALAFLIAGPTTTLPAMAAVWGLVSRRVFALYVGFSLFGAILMGYAYSLLVG